MAKPKFINADVIAAYLSAGIDPHTGKPTRGGCESKLKSSIFELLKILDEQDAVNRYVWEDNPTSLSSREIERLIYFRDNLCLFYLEEVDDFFLLPYALNGTIDVYGRYNTVTPIPFTAGEREGKDRRMVELASVLENKKLKVVYDVPIDSLPGTPGDYCVLIHDRTKSISQTLIPRSQLHVGLLDVMSDCIPFARTALLNATGVQGLRVENEDEESNVKMANKMVDRAAKTGEKWVAITKQLEIQELTGASPSRSDEFLMTMQSLDNFRLSLYGIENGGLFQKKAYQNVPQSLMNGSGRIGSPLQDGLASRQRSCDIANAIWGLGMSCHVAEAAADYDANLDGLIAEDLDQSGTLSIDQTQEVTTNADD